MGEDCGDGLVERVCHRSGRRRHVHGGAGDNQGRGDVLQMLVEFGLFFFFSSRRRHTRLQGDWSSDVCSSDLRVAAFVATLFFVSLIVFVVVRVLPGDPALIIMGTEGSPEATARLREAMGLNRPIAVQYADWLWRALCGDLGVSIQYEVPVGRLIASRLPVTLPLTLLAACLMSLTALPLGLYAAARHRRAGDYLAMAVSQIGIAVPSFWAGLLLIVLFSVRLGLVESGCFVRLSV